MCNFVDFLEAVICILLDIHWSYQNLLFWAGIVRHRVSANQIVRCFKLKKLENYMRYQVDFLLPLKLQKVSCYFGLCHKIILGNLFAGFFTFDLFNLSILMLGVHYYIVFISNVDKDSLKFKVYENSFWWGWSFWSQDSKIGYTSRRNRWNKLIFCMLLKIQGS